MIELNKHAINKDNFMEARLKKISITKSTTIIECMKAIQLGGYEIALVVNKTGILEGTVTDGDIRRALLQGLGIHSPVEPIMNRKFTSVMENSTRPEVLDLMRARTLAQVPIIDRRSRLRGMHLMREIIGSIERNNWAIVMAGGRGERLRPLTDSIPKPMIHVAGRPILERIILHLVGYGIRTIYLAVNYKSKLIEEHFKDGRAFGCRISYLREKKPLGTGGALAYLPRHSPDPLIVLNGDLITQVNIDEMLARHSGDGNRITVGVHEHHYTVPFGVLRERHGRVLEIQEKPMVSWLVNAGIYLIESALLSRISKGREYSLPALAEDCVARNEKVGVYRIREEWMDVGRMKELKKARGGE